MRSSLIAAASALLIAGFVSTPASAQERRTFTMTTAVPEGSLLYTAMTIPYVEAVRSLCGNAVEFRPFGAGVLASFSEGHLAVQDGRAASAHTTPIWIVNRDPANALLGSLPGGMGPEAMLTWLYNGGGRDLWVRFRRDTMGLHPIIAGMGTTEIFAHSHRAIRTLDDLRGLRMRSSGAWADILRELGATPVVLGGGDVFPMLQRRGIDAAEWLNPSGNVTTGLADIARFVIVPGVHSPSWPYELVFRADVFDALPASVRLCLEQAGELVTLRSFLSFSSEDLRAMMRFKERNEIVELTPEFVSEIKNRGRAWVRAKAAEPNANPWVGRIAESYFAFQDMWDANSSYRAR